MKLDNEPRLAGGDPSLIDWARKVVQSVNENTDKKAPLDSPAFIGSPTAPNPPTGDRTNKIATMQKFGDEFPRGTGWQKLASGLLIQWGASNNALADYNITFPISFSATPFAIVAVGVGNIGTLKGVLVDSSSATQFAARTRDSAGSYGSLTINWMAIGLA